MRSGLGLYDFGYKKISFYNCINSPCNCTERISLPYIKREEAVNELQNRQKIAECADENIRHFLAFPELKCTIFFNLYPAIPFIYFSYFTALKEVNSIHSQILRSLINFQGILFFCL